METLWQDVRFAARMLAKNPGFTAVAVLTLALGMGANTAIFSVVNAVLLRPLPYHQSDDIVLVYETQLQKGWASFAVSPANYMDWREQNHAFAAMASFRSANLNLTGSGEPERIPGTQVCADFFPLLGVPPQRGRTFTAEEDRAGRDHVVVLSDAFWTRRLGSAPDVLGRELVFNGEKYLVIGVMPRGFQIPGRTEVWTPAAFSPPQLQMRSSHFLSVLARLKPGVSLGQSQAEMSRIAAQIEKQNPDSNQGWGVTLIPLMEAAVGRVRRGLYVTLGAVGFVLLIACVNVANLLLARACSRQREFAVRAALGASRWRLARQLLTECALLALAAASLGVLVALWGIDLLRSINPGTLPRVAEIPVDWHVLLFTLGACLLSTLLFGMAPLAQLWKSAPGESLKETGRAMTDSRGHGRFRAVLVAVEVALSVALLIGAGLLLKSLQRLAEIQPGFQTANRLTALVVLPGTKYGRPEQREAFFQQLEERLQAQAGVKSATLVTHLPLTGGDEINAFGSEEIARNARSGSDLPSANYFSVGPGYFRAMGIGLLRGREFTTQDGPGAPRVVIINDVLARRIFPNENPVGKRLRIYNGPGEIWREIVGVASEVKFYGLTDPPTMQMYEPYRQAPLAALSVVVHTDGDPLLFAGALRAQVASLDKDQPLASVRSLQEVLDGSVAQPKFRAVLLGVFASLALLLAAAGLYGVMAYVVVQRTHEIGVRMALGAQPKDVLGLVLRKGLALTLAGVCIGLAAGAGLTQFLRALLFEVQTTDAATFALVALLMLLIGLLACWIPARRAARVDPMVALRYE